jgi:hypothetical protein
MLARVVFIVAIVLIALDVYALTDVILTTRERIRALPKFLWAFVIVLITPVGAILWFVLGKVRPGNSAKFIAPDDDPRFSSSTVENVDERIARLEEELRRLDDEDDLPPRGGLT